MKKVLLTTLCLVCSGLTFAGNAMPGSTIALLDKADLMSTKNVTLPLDLLVKGATYNVTCYMNNLNDRPVDVLFAVEAKNNLQHTSFLVNNTALPTHNQATLQNGESTFKVTVLSNGNGTSLVMKNLNTDKSTPVQVTRCTATPITTITPKAAMALNLFWAYNDTDKKITISVGNFFPDDYIIPPHSYKSIMASTWGDNIHIKSIE